LVELFGGRADAEEEGYFKEEDDKGADSIYSEEELVSFGHEQWSMRVKTNSTTELI